MNSILWYLLVGKFDLEINISILYTSGVIILLGLLFVLYQIYRYKQCTNAQQAIDPGLKSKLVCKNYTCCIYSYPVMARDDGTLKKKLVYAVSKVF